MRIPAFVALLTTFTALLAAVLGPASSLATPTIVGVRIEGKEQTLFEGPLSTEGHPVEASSDAQPRPCNGTNGGSHPLPGATPTAAAADAMTLASQTFDGNWTPGFDDYFITRFGPDSQDAATGEYWGLLVDDVLTAKGGCQVELAEGDQVLWAYNPFAAHELLTLSAAADSSQPPAPTALAALGQPFAVKVAGYSSSEGAHHELGPVPGAQVVPVATAANGFQTLETGSAATVTTAADGTASITFATPGWHRLKATASSAIRSNRLDVCVPPAGASDCGPPPADDQLRTVLGAELPPPSSPPIEEQPAPAPSVTGHAPPSGTGVLASAHAVSPAELRVGRYVLTPIDDRSPLLHFAGPWRRIREAGAWLGTSSVGAPGASLGVSLAAGRPALVVRGVRRAASVLIAGGGMRAMVAIPASRSRASRLIVAPRRARSGEVRVRIIKGRVGLDAVALLG